MKTLREYIDLVAEEELPEDIVTEEDDEELEEASEESIAKIIKLSKD